MKKNKEKAKISEYLHGLRKSNSKTLREWCLLNGFDSTLWSHLENGLWEIVSPWGKPYTTEELEVGNEIAFKQGYEECKEDFAVAIGMTKDTEFSEIVDKVVSKLKDKEEYEEQTNWKEMTPEESQMFKNFFVMYDLWDLVEDTSADGEGVGNELQFTTEGEKVIEAIKDLFFQEKERAYREGFEDGLDKANEDEQYIRYRK